MGGVVKRSEVAADGDLLHHALVYQTGSVEEVCSLDDTVSYRVNLVEAPDNSGLGVGKGVEDELHSEGVVGNGLHQDDRVLAGGFVGQFAVRKRYLFEISFCEELVVFGVCHLKKLILDR